MQRHTLITILVLMILFLTIAEGGGLCHNFATASSQIAFGANLTQMRPPIYDYAYALSADVPIQLGVNWLRSAAYIDSRVGPNFTRLYEQYAKYGYNWELRLDIDAITYLYGQNWTLQDWDSYVTSVVNDFPNVHAWEVGNEVLSGQAQYNTGYLEQSGNLSYAYYNILKDAYTIVKSHDSSDTVIAFGGQDIPDISELSLYNTGNFQDASYKLAAQVWADGGAQYCDAISIHAYGDNTGAAWLLNETPVYNNVASTLTLQQIWGGLINEYENLTKKPIWFTETGEPIDSPPNDPTPPIISNSFAKQAAFLNQSFTFLSSFPFTKAIFWFKLVGPSEYFNANNVLAYTLDDGLINQDGTARPATTVFEEFSPVQTAPPSTLTPSTVPSATPTVSASTPSNPPTLAPSLQPSSSTTATPEASPSFSPTSSPFTSTSTPSSTPNFPTTSPQTSIPELNNLFIIATILASTLIIVFATKRLVERRNHTAR